MSGFVQDVFPFRDLMLGPNIGSAVLITCMMIEKMFEIRFICKLVLKSTLMEC